MLFSKKNFKFKIDKSFIDLMNFRLQQFFGHVYFTKQNKSKALGPYLLPCPHQKLTIAGLIFQRSANPGM